MRTIEEALRLLLDGPAALTIGAAEPGAIPAFSVVYRSHTVFNGQVSFAGPDLAELLDLACEAHDRCKAITADLGLRAASYNEARMFDAVADKLGAILPSDKKGH